MNHATEEQLILYHYGEGEDRRALAAHLESCEACRANYQSLTRVLASVETLPVPARGDTYGPEVWRRLKAELPDRTVRTGSDLGNLLRFFQWPRWALAGAFALLMLVAFLAGRFWTQPPSVETGRSVAGAPQPISPQARERVLLKEIGDHLERSQLALIELIHTRTNGTADITMEQTLARELAAINRLFRQAAVDAGEPGMASVLEELEGVLVELANGPAQLSAEEFADLRERIDTDGLLFRIKVVSAQVRNRERDATRELAENRS
jgi:hypothetical protein